MTVKVVATLRCICKYFLRRSPVTLQKSITSSFMEVKNDDETDRFEDYDCCSMREFQDVGLFRGAQIDISDGFIHLSYVEQLAGDCNETFCEDRPNSFVVAVDSSRLGTALRAEPSRGGQLFPHLYAPLYLERCYGSHHWSGAQMVNPPGRSSDLATQAPFAEETLSYVSWILPPTFSR